MLGDQRGEEQVERRLAESDHEDAADQDDEPQPPGQPERPAEQREQHDRQEHRDQHGGAVEQHARQALAAVARDDDGQIDEEREGPERDRRQDPVGPARVGPPVVVRHAGEAGRSPLRRTVLTRDS
jgi:hypothetical protein